MLVFSTEEKLLCCMLKVLAPADFSLEPVTSLLNVNSNLPKKT